MYKNVFYSCAMMILSLLSCGKQEKENRIFTVKNNIEIPRSFETVEILKSSFNFSEGEKFEDFVIQDASTKAIMVSQFVDQNQDGTADVLLFQPKIDSKSEKQFILIKSVEKLKQDTVAYCYSRFVPERTDDYAWENNKVAFRTYGPTAQKMVEDSVAGGTLSSGIDAWLKKVDYPIINKWYAKNEKNPGAYHLPSDEGLDNFHVGSSRGVGGTAVKKDSSYYISKNFTNWKTITTGPIRTSFILDYADWDADGDTISEEKHISLDYGSNLSRHEIVVKGTEILSVGLTLHKNEGKITENVKDGWVSYWEPHEGSELGMAIVTAKENMISSEHYVTSQPDRSNLYAHLKVNDNKVVYFAGFAWKDSNQYPTKESWEKYLQEFSIKINNPLEIFYK